ncbi:MAG: hypothetical protein AMJ93_16430 [Anaerolineae bacterium SM23_84]|nr:MAG: hypothetical protein AMJ93_16430 [Anaerolineae bacterium SM23_84]
MALNALRLAATSDRDSAVVEGSLPEALLAALPPLLYGLALSAFLLGFVPLSEVVFGGPTRYPVTRLTLTPLILPGLLGTMLVVGGLIGARRRLPRWSYTWATGGVVTVLFALVLVGDELPYLISPTIDVLIVLALLGLLAAVALLAAWRGWVEAGLVGLGFGGTFATAVLFFATAAPFSRTDVGLMSAPAGLFFAAIIVAFLCGRSVVRWLALALTGMVSVWIIWGYRAILFAGMPSFSDASFHWRLLGIAMAGLLGPPVLAWLLEGRRPAVAT